MTKHHLIVVTLVIMEAIMGGLGQGKTVYLPRCKKSKGSMFVHVTSTRCLDAAGGSAADDTPLIIWDCHPDNPGNQVWTAVHVDQGYYHLTSNGSGSCVEVIKGATTDGSQLGITHCDTANANHLWKFDPIKPPKFQLVGKGSGKCATPKDGATGNSVTVVLAPCAKNDAQAWQLNTGKGAGAAAGSGASSGATSKGRCALWQAKVPKAKAKG